MAALVVIMVLKFGALWRLFGVEVTYEDLVSPGSGAFLVEFETPGERGTGAPVG